MKYRIIIVLTAFLFLQTNQISAQTADDWKPLTININGTNDFDGVDAMYTLSTCNNNEFIIVQLTNHNNYTVKACWKNVVINTFNQKLPGQATQDSVLIQPNSSVRGNCSGSDSKLVLKLTDFGILEEDFKAFMITNFDFVVIH